MALGELSVMSSGEIEMLKLLVVNSDSQNMVCNTLKIYYEDGVNKHTVL